MKNVFCKSVILAALLFLPFGATKASIPDGELTRAEIAVRDATSPVDPDVERSLIPKIEAYLLNPSHEVEVCFNKDLGMVAVQIINAMGIPVAAVTCDSGVEPVVYLQAPGTPGSYTLSITGISYQGSGQFNIN